MTTERPGVTWQTTTAPAIHVQGITIVPRTRVLHLPWPNGGLVWNHPESVRVTRDGIEQELPIVDVTWAAVMFLRAVTVIVLALAVLVSLRGLMSRRRRSPNE